MNVDCARSGQLALFGGILGISRSIHSLFSFYLPTFLELSSLNTYMLSRAFSNFYLKNYVFTTKCFGEYFRADDHVTQNLQNLTVILSDDAVSHLSWLIRQYNIVNSFGIVTSNFKYFILKRLTKVPVLNDDCYWLDNIYFCLLLGRTLPYFMKTSNVSCPTR